MPALAISMHLRHGDDDDLHVARIYIRLYIYINIRKEVKLRKEKKRNRKEK